ncbi:MAG TPA: GNAT family N-acetyltransferase [Luteimonas sp.]|nr:GNAT family N-acetyltransferase [Luteimonas sp.]
MTNRTTQLRPALELRLPRLDEEAEFLRQSRAASADMPTFLHYYDDGMPFEAYLRRLREQQQGIGLPSLRHVPSTFLFAFDGGRIVGRVSIRHRLNAHLARVGGHIGYAVVPTLRGRGYATAILAHAVAIARERLGIARVLVTCDDDNLASIKVIERNGGVLESLVDDPGLPGPRRRYWIG